MIHQRFSYRGSLFLFTCLLLSTLVLPFSYSMNLSSETPSIKAASMSIGARLNSPVLGRPTFVLEGAQFEVKIHGPGNIVDWSFSLFREYRSYDLSYGVPIFDSETSEYTISVDVAPGTAVDLYDLHVTVSDGIEEQVLEEANAVQVLETYPTNLKVFHITDTHISTGWDSRAERLLYSLLQAQMYDSDVVLITADLTDGPFDSASAFHLFKDIIRHSRVPVLVAPGNHDRDSAGDTYAEYIHQFGTDYFTTNIGPDIFIISSNTHNSPYHFNSTQLDWIEADLAASTAQIKILMHHAPLYYVDSDDYFIPESEAIRLQQLTNTYGVKLVVTGHLHNDRADMLGDTLWIITAPNGGPPWSWAQPGHGRNAFRIIRFQGSQPVYWNWTVDSDGIALSQPWDELALNRIPKFMYQPDTGGYLYMRNNLNYSLTGLIIDFIVNPPADSGQYVIHNATLLEKVEGPDAWLLRLSVNLVNGTSTEIVLYPDNVQPPTFNDVWSDEPGLMLSGMSFFANMSTEYGGMKYLQVNMSFNEGNYSVHNMARISNTIFRYVEIFYENGSGDFQVFAFDYAGNNSTSPFVDFIVTERPTTPFLNDLPHNTTTGNFLVTWTESTDPDGSVQRYDIQLSNDQDFTIILQEWNTTELQYNVTLYESDHYFLRVRAIDNFGGPSHWSNVEDIFVILPTIPPLPIGPILVIAAAAIIIIFVGGVVFFLWRRRLSSSDI